VIFFAGSLFFVSFLKEFALINENIQGFKDFTRLLINKNKVSKNLHDFVKRLANSAQNIFSSCGLIRAIVGRNTLTLPHQCYYFCPAATAAFGDGNVHGADIIYQTLFR
jgi:hypothetical protein